MRLSLERDLPNVSQCVRKSEKNPMTRASGFSYALSVMKKNAGQVAQNWLPVFVQGAEIKFYVENIQKYA
ncbi:MAG: hypothetical protein IKH56_06430 [Oscillospiraceae bacterium]|nr:hypothetical protein [Oscillospiraceae bacterium]